MKLKVMCFFISQLLCLTAFAQEKFTEYPAALLTVGANPSLFVKNGAWHSVSEDIKFMEFTALKSKNRVTLSVEDINLIAACFRKKTCQEKLSLKDLREIVESATQSNRDGGVIDIRRIGVATLVAISNDGYSYVFINTNTGGMLPERELSGSLSINIDRNEIYSSIWDLSEQSSKISITSFEQTQSHPLITIPMWIKDLDFKNGILYALAKSPNKKFHLSTRLTEWSGHGRYHEDWFILEIDYKTGKYDKFLLAENLVNASGQFWDKWRLQKP